MKLGSKSADLGQTYGLVDLWYKSQMGPRSQNPGSGFCNPCPVFGGFRGAAALLINVFFGQVLVCFFARGGVADFGGFRGNPGIPGNPGNLGIPGNPGWLANSMFLFSILRLQSCYYR